MKKKNIPSPAFRAFLDSAIEESKRILNLHDYRVCLHFVPRVAGYKHNTAHGGYTFQMNLDAAYMEVDIDVSRKAQERFDAGELRYLKEDILHELCHVLTWPITEYAGKRSSTAFCDLDENLTQKIAVIASKLLV